MGKKPTFEERFWANVKKGPSCWLWTGHHNGVGYGRISRNGKQVYVHRTSWELVHGPIPKGMYICHDCDNPLCVNPDHLFLGTPADNVHDMENKGRARKAQGPDQGKAKLTAAQVREIRALYATGKHTQRSLGRRFGVSDIAISKVCRRKTYTDISDNLQGKIAAVNHQVRGTAHGQAKLTEAQVREIRALYATGEHTQRALGERFGVSHVAIGRICRRETYADIT